MVYCAYSSMPAVYYAQKGDGLCVALTPTPRRRWTVRACLGRGSPRVVGCAGGRRTELCERAGVSATTLRNAERGEPTVAVGVMFELATLVGVELFGVPPGQLHDLAAREQNRLALLPAHVYPRPVATMTTSDPQAAYVWTWLPGASEPVVAGRIDADGPMHSFTYARSYRQLQNAMSLYEPELAAGPRPATTGGRLTIAGCLRDGAPDSWGQRVILARHLGHLTSASDVSDLSLLTYLLESGSDRIGALDFQASPTEYVPRSVSSSATLEQLMNAAADIEDGRLLPAALAEALTRGTSIGGARPKVLLTGADRDLIAKFSSTTDLRPVVKAEAVAMELARRVGLECRPVRVIEAAGKDVLLVDRFDRPGGGRRSHMVSALTILGLDEFIGARYGSYANLADSIRRSFTTRPPHCASCSPVSSSTSWSATPTIIPATTQRSSTLTAASRSPRRTMSARSPDPSRKPTRRWRSAVTDSARASSLPALRVDARSTC